MIRFALLLAVVGSLAVALVANVGAAPTRLTATVGPGYTITLKKGTKVVRTLKRGTYRITVRDRSDEHNFRLRGRPAGCSRASAGPGRRPSRCGSSRAATRTSATRTPTRCAAASASPSRHPGRGRATGPA
jgi:hypothetical protein